VGRADTAAPKRAMMAMENCMMNRVNEENWIGMIGLMLELKMKL
jgi:hypothetical protein